jgi:hypothetical protein
MLKHVGQPLDFSSPGEYIGPVMCTESGMLFAGRVLPRLFLGRAVRASYLSAHTGCHVGMKGLRYSTQCKSCLSLWNSRPCVIPVCCNVVISVAKMFVTTLAELIASSGVSVPYNIFVVHLHGTTG